MKVFKFGGASINSIERIQKVANIIQQYRGEKLLIIFSAMGKVTNELEKVAAAFYSGNKEQALSLFYKIKEAHLELALQLTGHRIKELSNIFTEVEWLLHDNPVRAYDYYYDQIVCCGELLSTSIMSEYLSTIGCNNEWMDVRDVVRTDDNFTEANIDWKVTQQKVSELIRPLFTKTDLLVTQGFVGATDENESTTLGREGSDYSAAIFANMLDAESQTIWKDVEGVMNADPKLFPATQIINELSYLEVIEMAYYGAQVIHPKTIKPLQNKAIPLFVKCFLHPDLPGTVISKRPIEELPPIIVVKEKQVLMQVSSRDFSFVEDSLVATLHELLQENKIRPNLSQNGAISLLCCMDDQPEKIEKLALAASVLFDVQIEKNCTLLTIRHYNEAIVQQLTDGRTQLLSQKTRETLQVLLKGTLSGGNG
jgi:aspartate kinase